MSDEKADGGSRGFQGATKDYKNNSTIENYVELRRQNPDEIIEVATTSGMEWVFSNEDMLSSFGIPAVLVVSTLDADQHAISELSLQLMELLIERKVAEGQGGTHLASRGEAISDSLVNHLISMMMDGLDWNDDLEMNRDLIVLIRHQIGGGASSALEKAQNAKGLRTVAEFLGAQYLEFEGKVSLRAVARDLGINPSTISRMYPEGSFEEAATKRLEFSRFFQKTETPFADLFERDKIKTEKT